MVSKTRIEAMLFAGGRSFSAEELAAALEEGEVLEDILLDLEHEYEDRGVTIVKTAHGWGLRTREQSSDLANDVVGETHKLTRAGLETLAVIVCYQPVTRSEIERVRGVQLSPGVMQQLLEAGFVQPGPRRDTPGRPLTWTTSGAFLEAFDMMDVSEITSYSRLRESGVFDLPQENKEAKDVLQEG